MEASNISFEQTQLENELEAINFQLEWLYQRGCNDEKLVTRKRELELRLRHVFPNLKGGFVFKFSTGVEIDKRALLSSFPDYNPNQPHPYSKK